MQADEWQIIAGGGEGAVQLAAPMGVAVDADGNVIVADTGHSRVIKLSSNEAALGPSPKAVAAYVAAQADLSRYPVGPSTALRDAIASLCNTKRKEG